MTKIQNLWDIILDIIFSTAMIIFVATSCWLIGVFCSIVVEYLQGDSPKTPEQLLEPLTQTQQECVMSLTTKENLVYAEKQSDPHYLTLGYKTGDKLHAVVVMANEDSNCEIVFEEVFTRQYYDKNNKRIVTKLIRFGMYDLTHDGNLDIFLGQANNLGKFGASYTFYTQQPNGSYKNITSLGLICTQNHTFNIIEMAEYENPVVSISHDLHCDWSREISDSDTYMVSHIKFTLTDTGRLTVK